LGAGYAQFGRADAVFALHKQMQEEAGVAPDAVSFLVLLTACSHAGLVKEGETLFDQMHGIDHLVSEHWACMVDLYGRAGNFGQMKKALLDHARPKSNHLPMFLSVLGACRKWRNMELARWAFQQALRLDANCLSAYVCMQNIYTFDEMQIDAEEE
jgi:pentatricopeptide repeat protein